MFLSRHRGTKPWMVTMEWWMHVRRMNGNQNGWNGKKNIPRDKHILNRNELGIPRMIQPRNRICLLQDSSDLGFQVFFFYHGVSGWERDLKIVVMVIWYNMVPISETSIILRTVSSNWLWGSVIFINRSRLYLSIWIINASHKAQTPAFNTRPDNDGFPKISNLGLVQKSQTLELGWWKHVYHIQM